MNDTDVAIPQGSTHGKPPWLLLIPQLPPKPDYLRVKLRRRILRVGAVSLRNAVYVLPNRDGTTEDFMWLRTELQADSADAIVCAASTVAGVTDAEIIKLFNEARDADYRLIAEEAHDLAKGESHDTSREVARLRRRIEEIAKVDFFSAHEKTNAVQSVNDLGNRDSVGRADTVDAGEFSGRTWVTRSNVFVDRIGSAWLIRRFIDRNAKFKFVPATGYKPESKELRFDMFEGEFSHDGDRCTFEVLLDRFSLTDSALHEIAEIVHDIDVKDGKFDRPEARGVESVLAGIKSSIQSDADRAAAGAPIFDALYSQFSAVN